MNISPVNWDTNYYGWHDEFPFIPNMSEYLINELVKKYTKKRDVIVDPMSGGGEIPFYAGRIGRMVYGIHDSYVGLVMSYARCSLLRIQDVNFMENRITDNINDYEVNPFDYEPLLSVFTFDTLRDLIALRKYLLDEIGGSDVENSVLGVVLGHLLSILVGKDDYSLVNHADDMFSLSDIVSYNEENMLTRSMASVTGNLISSLADYTERNNVVSYEAPPENHLSDMRSFPVKIEDDYVDMALTSIYHPRMELDKMGTRNWMKFWFVNKDYRDFNEHMKSNYDDNFEDNIGDMFKSVHSMLTDDSPFVVFVGGVEVDDEDGALGVTRDVCRIARDNGFEVDEILVGRYYVDGDVTGDYIPYRDSVIVLSKGSLDDYPDLSEDFSVKSSIFYDDYGSMDGGVF